MFWQAGSPAFIKERTMNRRILTLTPKGAEGNVIPFVPKNQEKHDVTEKAFEKAIILTMNDEPFTEKD